MPSEVLHLGMLVPVGPHDLEADDVDFKGKYKPGGYYFAIDDFSPKIFRYFRNRSTTALVQGDLISRIGGNNGETVITASTGTTTAVQLVGAPLTASAHVGNILFVRSNNDSAGGAPERQSALISSNTSASVQVDASRPFTTAIAASDVLDILGTWNIEDSADGDFAYAVYGVVVAQNGVADNNFGFSQSWGYCPLAAYTSASTSLGFPIAASSVAARLKMATAATTFTRLVGFAPVIIAALATPNSSAAPAFMQLDFGLGIRTTGAVS